MLRHTTIGSAIVGSALLSLLAGGQAAAQNPSCSDFPEPAASICRGYCEHACAAREAQPGCSTWLRRWHKLTGLNEVPCGGPNPECQGATCETFIPCNPGTPCAQPVCATTSEGGGVCVEGLTGCDGLLSCDTSADCPDGGICAVGSCCERNVCMPVATFCPAP